MRAANGKDAEFVKTWNRLWLFVRPYRRKLALSVVFGVFAALLWSFELLLTFPITVMFGEYRTLANYVRFEIDETSKAIERCNSTLDHLYQQLELLPEDGSRRRLSERVVVIDAQRRRRIELDVNTSKLWMLSLVESRIIRNLPDDQFLLFALLFVLILAVTFAKGASGYCQDLLAGSVAELVVMDLRKELFRRALQLDPQTLAMDGTANWLNDFTYTLQNLTNGLSELGGRIIREPLKAFACLAALFYLNWQLTLVFLLFMPILGALFHWLGQRLKRAGQSTIESMGRLYQGLEETFHNVKAVIAFDRSGYHRRRFHRENKNFYEKSMRLVRIDAIGAPIAEILGMLAASAVLLPAAFLVLRNTTSIWHIPLASSPPTFPDLALFYVLLAGVLEPLRKFSKFYTSIRLSTTIAERLFQRMDTQSLVQSPQTCQFLPVFSQKIEFRDVYFRYAATGADRIDRGIVLRGLDLTIHAGESIAIVGPNGSGKSTLVNLLPRFFDPDQGELLFDGINVRDARICDLREQMTFVTQETILFDDSIFENIRYGRLDATDAEIVDAALRAHVLAFSDALPQGLRTPVGEQGTQLSGGQRQRIALARAMLRGSRILIMDEATSAIDAQSEQLIHSSLRDYAKGRTTIVITHCLTPALLDFLTRIVVLDQGRVVAVGGHAELLSVCPLYRQLWDAQSQRAAA